MSPAASIASTKAAREFGAAAFARGISAPCLDSSMRAMHAEREIGDHRTVPELKAWIAGNTCARLSASVGAA